MGVSRCQGDGSGVKGTVLIVSRGLIVLGVKGTVLVCQGDCQGDGSCQGLSRGRFL